MSFMFAGMIQSLIYSVQYFGLSVPTLGPKYWQSSYVNECLFVCVCVRVCVFVVQINPG